MESLYTGGYSHLEALFNTLQRMKLKIMGHRKSNGKVEFGMLRSIEEYPLDITDIQKPGYYKLEKGGKFKHSFQSPKSILIPPEHVILRVNEKLEVQPITVEEEQIALFGIKPCELAAIKVLDKVAESVNNVYYRERRKHVSLIIVEECVEAGGTCFCGSLGTGPSASNGFDLAFARIDESTIVFKPGSNKGMELVRKIGLEPAPDSVYNQYKSIMESVKSKTSVLPPVDALSKALEYSMGDEDLWREVSKRCVGCANCNMVCPTCFCLEIDDRFEPDGYTRIARWTGCLSPSYGEVAGGHFRPELFMRYRHFVLHKFLFYPRQIGVLGCVGCGRCITWCPLGIDLRDTLVKVFEKYGGRE
ncbi:MAG: 4Fe-4S dicluster domain-containing protein [Thermoprotei archaeon]